MDKRYALNSLVTKSSSVMTLTLCFHVFLKFFQKSTLCLPPKHNDDNLNPTGLIYHAKVVAFHFMITVPEF